MFTFTITHLILNRGVTSTYRLLVYVIYHTQLYNLDAKSKQLECTKVVDVTELVKLRIILYADFYTTM